MPYKLNNTGKQQVLIAATSVPQSGDSALINQLKGFMLGNPVISCSAWKKHNQAIQMELFYYHALISLNTLASWKSQNCDANPTANCQKLFQEAQHSIGPFNPDNLYYNGASDWIGLDWIGLDWIGLDWLGSHSSASVLNRLYR
jgi:hypothetical protein